MKALSHIPPISFTEVSHRMIQFLLLLTSLSAVSCVLFHLITPDDARHADQYCSKNSELTYRLVGNKFADNKETHCFVKCFLKRIGLINLTTLAIDEEKFNNQNQGSSERYVYFEKSLDGTCKPYYDEWTRIVQNEGLDWMPSSFYFDHKDEMDFNTKYPFISKPIGISVLDICLKRNSLHNLNITLCLFSYLRWFDAYGRIDNNEVTKSFKRCHAKKCVDNGNTFYKRGPEKMASELRSCLQRNCPSYQITLYQLIKDSTSF